MTVRHERACRPVLLDGGPLNPIARPILTISAFRAPETAAVRCAGASLQFRQTKAWIPLGQSGRTDAGGASPTGRSATVRPGGDAFAAGAADIAVALAQFRPFPAPALPTLFRTLFLTANPRP